MFGIRGAYLLTLGLVVVSMADAGDTPPSRHEVAPGDGGGGGSTRNAMSWNARELKTGSDRTDKPHRRRYECAAHPECVAVGLTTGDCCPTPDAVVLDCCGATKHGPTRSEETQPSSPSLAPSSNPTITTGACSEHSACTALGLTGQCCPPTIQGDDLDCCTRHS